MAAHEEIVARALAEDVGAGDVTTAATVPDDARARARIVQKAPGVAFGFELVEETMRACGVEHVDRLVVEGQWRDAVPAEVALASGPAAALLVAERTALNFLGHLSGIATLTARFVAAVAGTGARILDTRKTTPGLRALEKAAVAAGGGVNHRLGLYDAILIKENHIALAGGVAKAVHAARRAQPELPIEIECRDLDEVAYALGVGADRLLLDNMDPETLRGAVKLRDANAGAGEGPDLEASGGVTSTRCGRSPRPASTSSPSAPSRTPRHPRLQPAARTRLALLQQFREPAVLQHPPAGLLLGAVVRLVLGEEDGLDRRAAARAGLALALVDLQRHRHLVGDLGADRLLVVVYRVAEDVQRGVEARDLLGVELGAFLEGREPRLPEDLVDPGAADPGDVSLVAQQRVQVARLVDRRGELLQRRGRPGFGPERRDHLVVGDLRVGSSFAQARCLVPNSRSRSSRPSSSRTSTREARSLSEARLSKTRSRPADIRWISSERSPNSTTGIFDTAAPRSSRARPAPRAAGRRSSSRSSPAPAPIRRGPGQGVASRRAMISTSGSSGMNEVCQRVDFVPRHSTGSRHPACQRTSGKEGLMQELPTIQPTFGPELTPDQIAELSDEIRALAAERDAVILAHNYQLPEVQDVANYLGDSLGLSRQAAATDAEAIAFCGVHFMAETASILSPEKTVLIPDLDAGCSLADSIDADQLRAWKAEHPGRWW